jgi:hypothetical protein
MWLSAFPGRYNITTPHPLLNLARAENCEWQRQGHFDGTLNLCSMDFGLMGFGMNSMGAHFNLVSLNIVTTEFGEAIKNSFRVSCAGMYRILQEVVTCASPACGCCHMIKDQEERLHMRQLLQSEDAHYKHFQLDKQSSDNSRKFSAWAKKTFGEDIPVQEMRKASIRFSEFCENLSRFQKSKWLYVAVIS